LTDAAAPALQEPLSHVLNTSLLARSVLLTNIWQAPVKVPLAFSLSEIGSYSATVASSLIAGMCALQCWTSMYMCWARHQP